jgi:hypothetical protein
MHIVGTAYRAEFGATRTPPIDPLTWVVPATVDLTIEYDEGTPLGTATLTRDAQGTITVDVANVGDQYRRWLRIRPYLSVQVVGNVVTCVGALTSSLNQDPDLTPWTELAQVS